MPCLNPQQVFYSFRDDGSGKLKIHFPREDVLTDIVSYSYDRRNASENYSRTHPYADSVMTLPCGKCSYCRYVDSRSWAIRMTHEAQLYDSNCFLTLTYAPEHLPKDGCVSKAAMQTFIKDLRNRHPGRSIRYFYCGEYGERFSRPHYHLVIFNYDFPDKRLFSRRGSYSYCVSEELKDLWPYGMSVVGDFSFESAGYVSRYCLKKKVGGRAAVNHYNGLTPEFSQPSLKPGIGYRWLEKYGLSDVFTHDSVEIKGYKLKPPRYYDKCLERMYPDLYLKNKAKRQEKLASCDSSKSPLISGTPLVSHSRLRDEALCFEARLKLLVREFEFV